jgi:hypothetical protein
MYISVSHSEPFLLYGLKNPNCVHVVNGCSPRTQDGRGRCCVWSPPTYGTRQQWQTDIHCVVSRRGLNSKVTWHILMVLCNSSTPDSVVDVPTFYVDLRIQCMHHYADIHSRGFAGFFDYPSANSDASLQLYVQRFPVT